MILKLTVIVTVCFTVNGQNDLNNKSAIAYDAKELLSKMFAGEVIQPKGGIKFENQIDSNYVAFDDQKFRVPNAKPFKFETEQETNVANIYPTEDNKATKVKFDINGQDKVENGINNSLGNRLTHGNSKKKRRRRKPKQQIANLPGFPNTGFPGPIRPGAGHTYGLAPGPIQDFGPAPGLYQAFEPTPGFNEGFGPVPGHGPSFGPNRLQPEFNGQYRPPRRPQSSLASDALTAVTGALTSIAHNDDYQCVARLLCEAAAGGALGGSNLLESVSGLQPLLTLLSAYNGISSNPLFVFGRAAFLGMSSKSNPGSCRYAYPLCPTDPEELVHYLNNHNGGFFRFFNAPQNGQQNLEQFYNQLSQNYGLYQPHPGNQEFYGLLNPMLHPAGQPNLYPNGYGYQQNYGFAYPYNQNYNNGIRFKNYEGFSDDGSKLGINVNNNKIEKRILNKQTSLLNDNVVENYSKWLFPDEDDDTDVTEIGVHYVNNDDFGFTDNRKSKTLKFPDEISTLDSNVQDNNNKPITFYTAETIRKAKGISFPKNERNINDYNTNTPIYANDNHFFFNTVNKRMNNISKGVSYNYSNHNANQDEPGVITVYVVRGNGDPNNPEIVKLRPGETL